MTETVESQTGRHTARLVERARAGDRDAYDELFAHAADRLHLFIRMRLGKRLRAKLDSMDVLQEAYAEAHKAFARFTPQGEGAFARWLCRIAENRLRGLADHHGAQKRRPPGGVRQVEDVLDRARASGTGPVTCAARREGRERLERAMEDALTDPEREAVLLRHFQGRTIDDIAHLTAASPSAVRRTLGRALRKLGGALRGSAEGPEPGGPRGH